MRIIIVFVAYEDSVVVVQGTCVVFFLCVQEIVLLLQQLQQHCQTKHLLCFTSCRARDGNG